MLNILWKNNYEDKEQESNRKYLIYLGGINDGTLRSVLVSTYRFLGLILPIYLFAMKAMELFEKGKFIEAIEAIHWILLELLLVFVFGNFFTYSSLFFEIENTIKTGFNENVRSMTKIQTEMRKKSNKDVKNYTLIITVCCVSTYFLFLLKGPLLLGGWNISYPIWLPFEIDDWLSYTGAMVISCLVIEPISAGGCTNWLIYLTLAVHLIAQFRILQESLIDLNNIANENMAYEEKSIKLTDKLKECIKHHNIILKYFDDFQTFYDFALLVSTVGLGLMLCTLGFILLDPETPFASKAPIFVLLIPEILFTVAYCLLGQLIADAAEDVSVFVYNTDWYTFPIPVQKDILIMLIGCHRIKQLSGMGLQKFSLQGLSEIIQTAFSYFNLMMVLMNSN